MQSRNKRVYQRRCFLTDSVTSLRLRQHGDVAWRQFMPKGGGAGQTPDQIIRSGTHARYALRAASRRIA